jgi:type VI secretion system protein ImpG
LRDELLAYYERELTFLRQMGAQFAEKYPKIASRLALEPDRCEDPHVERLLEAFAFLAARVHLKIDDEFPEITEALFSVLYPHYLRPIPSMSIAEFNIDPEQSTPPEGLLVSAGSVLRSRPVRGQPFKFRSSYDVSLWPLSLSAAQWLTPDRIHSTSKVIDSAAVLRLELQCTGAATFGKLKIPSLRFYLNGESNLVHDLYEILCNNCTQIWVRPKHPGGENDGFWLDGRNVQAVGFGENEAVIPYPRRSFLGYRLLQEYFSFPEKFLFVDIGGLEQLSGSGFTNAAEMLLFISPFARRDRQRNLEVGVSEKTFKLGCTPVINLIALTAEPILISHTRSEYPVVPDVSRPDALEVFSVDEVVSVDPRLPEPTLFFPFYSHRYAPRTPGQVFWHASRRPSPRPHDERSDVYINLVDLSGRPLIPNAETLTVRVTCTNSDLPAHMPFGGEAGDLELEGAAPIKRITMLRKPTNTIRPGLGKNANWPLISHLSLNYLSLVDEGKDALQNVLRLYNFADSPSAERQIQGITALHRSRRFARVASERGISFARGTSVDIELDEDQFVGGGVFLFASVLERFLSLYVSMNSFCELTARTTQRKEVLKHWQPRSGERILI